MQHATKLLPNGILLFPTCSLLLIGACKQNPLAEKISAKHPAIQGYLQQTGLRALRAQMHPHFVFNWLNSLNRYIVKIETCEATQVPISRHRREEVLAVLRRK